MSNQTVQRTGASRFAQRQIERHRRLAPVADFAFDDIRLILVLLIVRGGLIAIQPAFSRARVVALWSDFNAFQARVAARDDGKAVLALGGEREAEGFKDLMRKLAEVSGRTAVPYLGVLVSAFSAFALVLDIRRKKSVEPVDSENPRLRSGL